MSLLVSGPNKGLVTKIAIELSKATGLYMRGHVLFDGIVKPKFFTAQEAFVLSVDVDTIVSSQRILVLERGRAEVAFEVTV
jgi:hypothetical protein